MKRFSFRLNRVRDLRKWREHFAQRQFADAQNNRQSANRELDEITTQIEDHIRIMEHNIQGGMSAGVALVSSNYSNNLRMDVKEKESELKKCDHEVENCRNELIEKSREKQVLDRLYERQLKEFIKEQNRIEQTIMDDDAAQRSHHKR